MFHKLIRLQTWNQFIKVMNWEWLKLPVPQRDPWRWERAVKFGVKLRVKEHRRSSSAANLFFDLVFEWKRDEKPLSQRYVVGKGRRIVEALSASFPYVDVARNSNSGTRSNLSFDTWSFWSRMKSCCSSSGMFSTLAWNGFRTQLISIVKFTSSGIYLLNCTWRTSMYSTKRLLT